ncbi:DinB family protein [Aeromicrobium halocynthiae]|uniref:DinB family protein n=1 Tax=Aeromicrobium halocynthiae TaxID=560557 RepID=A0ABP5HUE1_9ACTN
MLRGFLEFHRQTLMWKISGLDRDALLRTHPPSTMTLLGMVKHLAYVEDYWFGEVLRGVSLQPWADVDWSGDPDWDWRSAADESVEDVLALWQDAIARSDDALTSAGEGLDTRAVRPPRRVEGDLNLRWIVVHMVEEYSRHNGHADLLREAIDGQVGE